MTRNLLAALALAATFAVGLHVGAATRDVSTLRAENAALRAVRACARERVELLAVRYELQRGNALMAGLLETAGWVEDRWPDVSVWLAGEGVQGPEAGSP